MKRYNVEGVIPAMLTPFTKHGKNVDYERAQELALRLASQGVHGIFICGTTGEGLLMTPEERMNLLEKIIKTVGDKIKIIVHTGALDLPTTLKLTQHAYEHGAYSAGIVAPGFYAYDEQALFNYFKTIANQVFPFPIMLYNLPSCARNTLTPQLVSHLAKTCENIIGIKDSGGVIQTQYVMSLETPSNFIIINGCDEFTFHSLLGGANGSVSSTANVIPEIFLKLFNALKKGEFKTAKHYQAIVTKATKIFHYGAMIAYYKEGLRLRGFDAGFVRPPQRELTKKEKQEFLKQFEKLSEHL